MSAQTEEQRLTETQTIRAALQKLEEALRLSLELERTEELKLRG